MLISGTIRPVNGQWPMDMGIFEEYELPNITIKWLKESAFEPSAWAMAAELELKGYAYRTICSYLSCVAHFSHWCTVEFIKIEQIDTDVVEYFVLDNIYLLAYVWHDVGCGSSCSNAARV